MGRLLLEAKQTAGSIHNVEEITEQIESAELILSRKVNDMVDKWSQGSVAKEEAGDVLQIIASIEDSLNKSIEYSAAVESHANKLVGGLRNQSGKLTKASVKMHYENVKNS